MADRWAELQPLLSEAAGRPREAWPAFVDEVRRRDESLAAELAALLEAESAAATLPSPATISSEVTSDVRAPDAARFESGQRLGPYELDGLLGAGGMGEVYRAVDTRLRRPVAIKVLAAPLARDPERRRRMEQEARAAGILNHPNILTVHDVGNYQGSPFIVSELLEGETLRDRLERAACGRQTRGLSPGESLELMVPVAAGLAAAHQRGIVHRDMKPENVFITRDGRIKVLDFGIAKLVEPEDQTETATGAILGTVGYMSPEQLRAEPATPASDVFACGTILYELLTGRSPFRRDSHAATAGAILHEKPAALVSLPPSVTEVVHRCLEKSPTDRYQTGGELAEALRGLAVSGVRAPALPYRRRVLGAITVVAIAVIIGLSYLVLARRNGPALALGAGGRPAIAVGRFANPANVVDLAWLTTGMPNLLSSGLAQTPGVDVISRERLDEVAMEMGSPSNDGGQLLLAARKAGAGAVIGGAVFKQGEQVRVEMQMHDVASGRILLAHSARNVDVFPIADDLSRRIRGELELRISGTERPVADVTTASAEAFRWYSQGLDALDHVRYAEALACFKRAVEIDPSFAAAYAELEILAGGLGDIESAAVYRRNRRQHAAKLSERQRLLAEASDAESEADFEKAKSLYHTLVERYPDESRGYLQLSVLYESAKDGPMALSILDRGIAALPAMPVFLNERGYLLLRRGRHEEAIQTFEDYIRMAPREPNGYDSLAEAYLQAGRPEIALEKYNIVLTYDPRFPTAFVGRAWAYGMLGRYAEALAEIRKGKTAATAAGIPHADTPTLEAFLLALAGEFAAAHRTTRAARDAARTAGQAFAVVDLSVLDGWMELQQRRYKEALAAFGQAANNLSAVEDMRARRHMELLINVGRGIGSVGGGRVDQARQALERVPNTDGITGQWYQGVLRGEILLSAGDAAGAESALRAGIPGKMWMATANLIPALFANHFFQDALPRALAARGDRAGAIKELRQLTTPAPNSPWTRMLMPLDVLQLARLLEQEGERAAAVREYTRFLDLWKAADPDLSELAEARAARKRLGDSLGSMAPAANGTAPLRRVHSVDR